MRNPSRANSTRCTGTTPRAPRARGFGEPVFAPVPGDPSEDHGYWTTYAMDRTDGTSRLLVFAAREPEAGPVARVRIPVRVPPELHGCRQPTEE
ncbi:MULTISPECIES: carotenoid oxygenase family protein [Streptomyces]|uniref:Dioxygenase n=1 Tax=Streptomyces mirabilis TaxID=68239 RepID=A0ABU3V2T1_9ACTN|nr:MULTISPECIES: carotenoid oxygenase family protein [Streptomyces]MCX4615097.1 carotenoid oxygenase family protein [Streptomyces mirabilis]MCX5346233.1 carotenoid oxygenase family protein [Streptomyces mirabilis]MCX5356425.1 carotenoid oxygenase family protein [Streptomyces mirabilis]MDU9000373.1 carotenoid oxygenase family protein [Streptomyces mirabilis]